MYANRYALPPDIRRLNDDSKLPDRRQPTATERLQRIIRNLENSRLEMPPERIVKTDVEIRWLG